MRNSSFRRHLQPVHRGSRITSDPCANIAVRYDGVKCDDPSERLGHPGVEPQLSGARFYSGFLDQRYRWDGGAILVAIRTRS
jgi:hypothetical protein